VNDVQKKYLEILKAIDEICKKEALSYMLFGGTLLGAIREGGFIEWDDDADIMMHRKEYNIFKKASKKYLDDYGLFLDEEKRFPRAAYLERPEINVEIVLIDSMPESKFKRKFQRLELKLLQSMLTERFDFSQHRSIRIPISLGIWALGRLLDHKTKLELYHRVSQTGNNVESDFVFFSNERYRFMTMDINRKLLKETTQRRFEDTELLVPKEWDAVLKLHYGDQYMTPKRENYYI